MNLEKGETIVDSGVGKNQFSLRKSEPLVPSRTVEVDFSPVLCSFTQKLEISFPIFNFDRKNYMPSFLVPAQAETYRKHEKLYAELHHKKLIEASEDKEQIYVPKPSNKNSCCCVCKVYYDDYLTHVNNPSHTQKMHQSTFNEDIASLCQRFSSPKRTTSLESTSAIELLECLQKPRKRRKVEPKKKGGKSHSQSGISTMIDSLALINNRTSAQLAA